MRKAHLELSSDRLHFTALTPPIVQDDEKEGSEGAKKGADRLVIEELLKVQRCVLCGPTLELSGPLPAWRVSREAVLLIIDLAAQAPSRWRSARAKG
jgi:hypothetical protein